MLLFPFCKVTINLIINIYENTTNLHSIFFSLNRKGKCLLKSFDFCCLFWLHRITCAFLQIADGRWRFYLWRSINWNKGPILGPAFRVKMGPPRIAMGLEQRVWDSDKRKGSFMAIWLHFLRVTIFLGGHDAVYVSRILFINYCVITKLFAILCLKFKIYLSHNLRLTRIKN